MIDRFRVLAQRLSPATPGFVAAAAVCFVAFWCVLLGTSPRVQDRYLVPLLLGLLWSLSAWSFVLNFKTVPDPAAAAVGVFERLQRRLQRVWCWLLALLFAATTGALLVLSFRVLAIWYRDYGV